MAPRPSAPSYVQFFPTLRCNQACDFCFNRGLPEVPDVAPADFDLLLDRLLAAGVRVIDLLGGEPTLHPQLDRLVASVAARRMRCTISTNGFGDLDLLERLEDLHGDATLSVGVSVNDDEIPDRLAEYLRRRLPMVKSLCGRDGRLPIPVEQHLARRGAEFYLIFRDPLSAADLPGCPSYPEYAGMLAQLRGRHQGVAGVSCGGLVPGAKYADVLRDARCPAGTTKISLLPDGSAYPCYLLFSRPEFGLGNLLTDGFDAVWDHPRLEFFRTFTGNHCPRGECAEHAQCHGGCPSVALLVAGDITAPDPRCVPERGQIYLPKTPGGK